MSEKNLPPVAVIGGGGFGRAIATAAHRNGRDVILWSRSSGLNEPYKTTKELADLRHSELLFLAVPSPYVPETAAAIGRHLNGSHLLVHVSRGLLGEELMTLSQHLRKTTPCRRIGALAGPLDAEALRDGLPTGAIVGSRFPEVAVAVREAIGGSTLRIYESRDVVGVEIAAAVVGLLALAAGYGRARGASPATLSVFLTRGMNECTRIGVALGAQAETFGGLAGFGDLMAVIGGDDRPEIRLGEALASGMDLAAAGAKAGAHIEGVSIATRLVMFAERAGLEAPMARVVAAVLAGELRPEQAIDALMARRAGRE
ncbi:MAG: glycerol-3-phosphate dehydrogenase (NAD(P)+) [Polyangiales bacterium]|jgi:glycerol-3-phosphate dehydrogenase (NAD(P)+)